MPHVAGIGGGGMMLIHQLRHNKTVVLDFQAVSPGSLNIGAYTDNPLLASLTRRSVAVPGLLAGLWRAHIKYGSGLVRRDCCGWGDMLRKNLDLLNRGFRVTDSWIQSKMHELEQKHNQEEFKKFLSQDGYSVPGSSYNREMIKTLDALYDHPEIAFYSETGAIGRKLIKDLEGQIEMKDLVSYRVEEREPLSTIIKDYQVFSSPAPSGGPEMIAILNAMEAMISKDNSTETFDTAEYLTKVRNILESVHVQQRLLGDPAADAKIVEDEKHVSTKKREEVLISKEAAGRWFSDKGSQSDRVQLHSAWDSWEAGTQ